MRVLDEAVREAGDVHEAVLVHADIHEGAEVGDVGDGALEDHVRLQILHGLHVVAQLRGLEGRPRIPAGLIELGDDVAHRGQAALRRHEGLRVQAFQEGAVADHRGQRPARAGGDSLRERVGLRVHRRSVEGVVAVINAQEARGLLEGAGAEAGYVQKGAPAREGAVAVAVGDDGCGEARRQTGNPRQERRRGHVHVDADGVHAVLHYGIELPGQRDLADVMLVLAHADGFGLDLHQFGERVLQAPGDGDGAPEGHIQIGEFLRRQLRGGIDGGAGFGHGDPGGRDVRLRCQQAADEGIGFPAGGAVANGDEFHLVAAEQRRHRVRGLRLPLLGGVRKNGGVVHELAGAVDHGHLHAGPKPRVQAHGRPGPGGRCQQQVLEVAGEHGDRLGLGALAQVAEEVRLQAGEQLDPPGPAQRRAQPAVGRPALVRHLPVPGQHRLAGVRVACLLFRVHDQGQLQEAGVAAAEHGQGPMRGHAGQRLTVLEVVAELGRFGIVSGPRRSGGAQQGIVDEEGPQPGDQVRVLGPALHEDLPGAVQGVVGAGDTGISVEVGRGDGRRLLRRALPECVRQRLEAGLAGDLCLGAALRLVGQVQVLEAALAVGGQQLRFEGLRELALLADAVEDRAAPGLEFREVAVPFLQLAQLAVIEAAGHLLAVAGDEGNGGAVLEQGERGAHLGFADGQFGRQALGDGHGLS
ncbi:hypothetical protein HRUBRA_00941 [Pseudohaliea rubra DSM 19751]|uniref:Uncharacterized protein n=1 Tax=Pseudohaliea rubra DSM 19751 TaxID=1265313 RepID=A0A095XXL8_9GAMM|nr:hypothetical protein HRUBRA_00941 [Pseudohaliea rubra DSM 19751]